MTKLLRRLGLSHRDPKTHHLAVIHQTASPASAVQPAASMHNLNIFEGNDLHQLENLVPA
jgi:hypothetical protein